MDKNQYKPTILIDLDGVLNTYDGNYVKDYIPPINAGAKEFLETIYKKFKLVLFTTRDINFAKEWLTNNCLEHYFIDVTNTKVPAYLMIDDRCICFNGDYNSLQKDITNFIPWYKN